MSGIPSSSALKPGDLLLVAFPFTDLSTTRCRPAVVLSPSRFHATTDDIVVCMVTSRVRGLTEEVPLAACDLARGSIPRASVALVSKLATLHRSTVARVIGRLSPDKLSEVRAALAAFLQLD